MTRGREGIPEELTFKLRYNYEEGASDGKGRRNSILVRGNGQYKDPETGKDPASKRMVSDEENDQSRPMQDSGD